MNLAALPFSETDFSVPMCSLGLWLLLSENDVVSVCVRMRVCTTAFMYSCGVLMAALVISPHVHFVSGRDIYVAFLLWTQAGWPHGFCELSSLASYLLAGVMALQMFEQRIWLFPWVPEH